MKETATRYDAAKVALIAMCQERGLPVPQEIDGLNQFMEEAKASHEDSRSYARKTCNWEPEYSQEEDLVDYLKEVHHYSFKEDILVLRQQVRIELAPHDDMDSQTVVHCVDKNRHWDCYVTQFGSSFFPLVLKGGKEVRQQSSRSCWIVYSPTGYKNLLARYE